MNAFKIDSEGRLKQQQSTFNNIMTVLGRMTVKTVASSLDRFRIKSRGWFVHFELRSIGRHRHAEAVR